MTTELKNRFLNVDEYFATQPEAFRATLEQLRRTIKKAAPEAQEVISYNMPAFKQHGVVAYFAAYKNHLGLYIRPDAILAFKDRLGAYQLSKGTIQFPWTAPFPEQLVTEMIQYVVQLNRDKKASKDAAKRKKTDHE